MRCRLAIIAAVGLWISGALSAQRVEYPAKPLPMERIQQWARAVWTHEPGRLDPGAVSISQWTPPDLYMLFVVLRGLPQFGQNRRVSAHSLDGHEYPRPASKDVPIHALELASESDENVNRLLKRAALLHTDIALLLSSPAPFDKPSPFSGRTTFQAKDGRHVAPGNTGTHLEFVSWLFDGVKPDAGSDPIVRKWYEVTAAALQAEHRVGDAEWIVSRGLGIAENSPILQFHGGALAEVTSTPRIRYAMPSVTSEPVLLQRAVRFHERAVQLAPDFAEARLHLGRVLSQLGRHDDALRELTRAQLELTDRALQYYAALFLGQEQVLAANFDGAQLSFGRARELYPRAQSPLLAQADLWYRQGDSTGSTGALRQLLVLPADEAQRFDPWWQYHDAHVRDAKDRVAAWRAVVTGETAR